jgi:NAD+ kinase
MPKIKLTSTPEDEDADDGRRSSSEGEGARPLEVVFEDEGVHRRRSSLAPESSFAPPRHRPDNNRRKTQCFVHSLIEKHDGIPMREASASYEGLAQEQRIDKDPHNPAEESHHSRLLTKKQISDMAFGIRELSKKLAQIRLRLNVRNVFILGKAHDETLIAHSRETTEWLLAKNPSYKVYVEDTMKENEIFDAAGLLAKNEGFKGRLRFWNNQLCHDKPQTFDIVLAVSLNLPFF